MRVFMRNQLIEILDTVAEGIRHVSFAGIGAAGAVLGDCSDALEMIVSVLEENLSQTRFDEYRVRIDKITACLTSSVVRKDALPAAEINAELAKIIDNLSNEPEVKLEVVFFPYKASMWDSLESVWLAADADPRCNATVVPISYYEKSPNGAFSRKLYEGNLLPDYVPIVHCDEYDLSAISPDIAYIHNPYDSFNYVTSVDPRFYSHEIKKYVEKLVYVPYYVSRNGNGVNYNATVLNGGSDIIIAFNNTDYNAYRMYRQDKDIAVLGSPKIDRVLRLERKKPDIPEAWKPALSGKKLFLLITSVSTLLNYDMFGEKLRKIISIFENRDDIAVIWRPHPLSNETINSMRPELLADYLEVQRHVETGSFGVVDTTADIELSIALSDAYIGPSATSIFYMYCVTGKPMYTVNFESVDEFTQDDYDEALRAEYLSFPAVDGDMLWGSCINFNGLCRVDTKDGSMTYMGEIPGDFPSHYVLYTQTVKLGDELLLTPAFAGAFAKYNLTTGAFSTYELPEPAKADRAFAFAREYKQYVYFIPYHSRAIVRYDKTSGEFEYFYDWYEKMAPYITSAQKSFFQDCCLANNSLFMPSAQGNIVAELKLERMELIIHTVGNAHNRYLSIAYDGRCFWLTRHIPPSLADDTNSIVRWDYNTGKTTEFSDFPKRAKEKQGVPNNTKLRILRNVGDYIIAFPSSGANMVVKIDPKTCKMSEFDMGLSIDVSEREQRIFNPGPPIVGIYDNGGDTLFATLLYDYSLLKINKATGSVEKLKLRFKDDSHKVHATARQRFARNHIYKEHIFFPAGEFVDRCVSGDISPRNEAQAAYHRSFVENTDGTCGEKVHEYVISSLVLN